MPLRQAVNAAEARVVKIEGMKARIDEMLADPALYTAKDPRAFKDLEKKRAEIVAGLTRAEALWEQAQERLDEASG